MRWKQSVSALLVTLASVESGLSQTSVPLRTQAREADFSGYPWTKPAKTVPALPGSCSEGEVVALSSGSASGLYLCVSGGAWAAVVAHQHSLSDVTGISGKHGSGSLVQSFSGGATQAGQCAEFDDEGNLRGSGGPCSPTALPNLGQSFVSQTAVVVVHGRGSRDVLAQCYDAAGSLFLPDRLLVSDANTVIAYFSQAQSGSCVVNSSSSGGGGGAVMSVFGRTGAVTAASGDYQFSQIGGSLAASQIAGGDLLGGGQKLLTATTIPGNGCAVWQDGAIVSSGLPCGAGITSVFGRVGAVASQAGDYSFGQISGTLAAAQIGSTEKLGGGSKLLTLSSAPADGCATWTGGAIGTTGEPCGSGGGSVVSGIGLTGSGSAGSPLRIDPTGGVAAQAMYSALLSDWGAMQAAGSAAPCAEKSIAAVGATPGETVVAGWPNTLPPAVTGVMYTAANLIVVRLCNLSGSTVTVANGLMFSGRIIRGF